MKTIKLSYCVWKHNEVYKYVIDEAASNNWSIEIDINTEQEIEARFISGALICRKRLMLYAVQHEYHPKDKYYVYFRCDGEEFRTTVSKKKIDMYRIETYILVARSIWLRSFEEVERPVSTQIDRPPSD